MTAAVLKCMDQEQLLQFFWSNARCKGVETMFESLPEHEADMGQSQIITAQHPLAILIWT